MEEDFTEACNKKDIAKFELDSQNSDDYSKPWYEKCLSVKDRLMNCGWTLFWICPHNSEKGNGERKEIVYDFDPCVAHVRYMFRPAFSMDRVVQRQLGWHLILRGEIEDLCDESEDDALIFSEEETETDSSDWETVIDSVDEMNDEREFSDDESLISPQEEEVHTQQNNQEIEDMRMQEIEEGLKEIA